MRKGNKLRYGLSLPDSHKNTVNSTANNSSHKLPKMKDTLKPLQTVEKNTKVRPFFPETTIKQQKIRSIDKVCKTLVNERLQSLVMSKQKQFNVPANLMEMQDSIKIKRTIRVKTQHLKSQNINDSSKVCSNSIKNSIGLRQHRNLSLTTFEENQIKIYDIFYPGNRRINCQAEFTDSEGNSIIQIGDSIIYRYQILSQLGHGSFGYVYKVRDHKRNEVVAMKIIKNHPKYRKQAKVEIKLLEEVIYQEEQKYKQCIVTLKHAFLFRGHPCLVFQLLHLNLYQFCQQIQFIGLTLNLIKRISVQVLTGLKFLENNNIIHCDIKPENIMIKRNSKMGIKLIDFGSGCFEGEQIYNYIQSRYYRAPQITFGIKYTQAIDMWSFGCVVVELFTGAPIFPGKNQLEQINLFVQALGLPPQQFLSRGTRSHLLLNKMQSKQKNSRKLQSILKKNSDPQFFDFVQKILAWVPQQRLKASQALHHPWISSLSQQSIKLLGDDQDRQQINEGD